MVKRLAGASLDKASRFTDWAHRPLTERQIKYALADVVHLRTVYDRLQRLLAGNGRAAWFEEEMADLVDPAIYRSEPIEAPMTACSFFTPSRSSSAFCTVTKSWICTSGKRMA